LLDQHVAALTTARATIDTVCDARPNSRDYYVRALNQPSAPNQREGVVSLAHPVSIPTQGDVQPSFYHAWLAQRRDGTREA